MHTTIVRIPMRELLGIGEIYLRTNQKPSGPERPASRGTKGLPAVRFEILQYDQANNSRFGSCLVD